MRTLGRNMAWVLRGLAGSAPAAPEARVWTNFIR